MSDCIFCKIVSEEISSEKIYEDEYTMAFLDSMPSNPGHTLVIPKDHFENIYGLPDEDICRLMISVKKVATAVKNGVDADGLNISMNNESAAGQVIFHAHIHIIPRFIEDGHKLFGHKPYKEGEAKKVAEKIRKELAS